MTIVFNSPSLEIYQKTTAILVNGKLIPVTRTVTIDKWGEDGFTRRQMRPLKYEDQLGNLVTPDRN